MMKHHKKLEQNALDDTIGVPTLKGELQKDYDRSENYNNSINVAISLPNSNETEYLPSEVKEMLYEYLCSIPANPYRKPNELAFIIEEKTENCILGESSVETTAEVLNNRIKIYLSEKSN